MVNHVFTNNNSKSFLYLQLCCILPYQYENHSKSLKLEEQTLKKIRERIQEKVMSSSGTWIDWQYLLDAASLLKKVGACENTLNFSALVMYLRHQLTPYEPVPK